MGKLFPEESGQVVPWNGKLSRLPACAVRQGFSPSKTGFAFSVTIRQAPAKSWAGSLYCRADIRH